MVNSLIKVLLFFLLLNSLQAQEKAHLAMIGAAIGDSVVLRWAVANPEGWMKANVAGYIIEKTTLDKQNKVIGKSAEVLGKGAIHPWSYSKLEQSMNRQDTFALLAAQCLYGKSNSTAKPSANLIQALQDADEESMNKHAYATMAADFSAHAADIMGWRFVDRNIKKDLKYIYTIHCAQLNGKVWSDTALFVMQPADYIPLGPMPAPTVSSGEKLVIISWKRPEHLGAFYIERSSDGKNYERLNKSPFMDWTPADKVKADSLVWIDSIGINYKPFNYRLIGINPFAQLSPTSAAAIGYGSDKTPPMSPLIKSSTNLMPGQLQIQWESPLNQEPIQGIIVARTIDPTLNFKELHSGLLSPNIKEYTDLNASQYGTNYYTVGLVDTAGNIGWSPLYYAVTKDFGAPVQPGGLEGNIDTSGLVTLHWDLGKDPDLFGYQIYFANQADHEFVPLADSMLKDTVYQYKIGLENLTEHIFFKIQAFDKSLKGSVLSEMIDLKKPDKIAPDAPVIDDYQVKEGSVYLHWRSSIAKDAISQAVLRRKPNGEWMVLGQMPMGINTYKDTLMETGQNLEYAIQTIDDDGLKSLLSFPVGLKVPQSTKRAVSAFSAVWQKDKKQVRISWNILEANDHFLLYRGTAENGLELHANISGKSNEYIDIKLQSGEYRYLLKPILKNNMEGQSTETISVIVP